MKEIPYCQTVEDYETLLPWNINLHKVISQDKGSTFFKNLIFFSRGCEAQQFSTKIPGLIEQAR